MSKRFFQTAAVVIALLIFGVASAMAANPVVYNIWKSGNAVFECGQIGTYSCAYKIEGDDPVPANGIYSNVGDGVDCDSDSKTNITISNSNGKTFDWSASPNPIGAVIVKAGRGANVWFYDPQSGGDTRLYAYQNKDISHVTFCWNQEDSPPPQGVLEVIKFYDANANGIEDSTESHITGWQIKVDGVCDFTRYTAYVAPGTYEVTEDTPIERNWIHTTPTTVDAEVAAGSTTTVKFGNVCLGAGGGKTLGFWSNRNGFDVMNDGGSVVSELSLLTGYNLRTANGAHFDPTTYTQFRSWLLSASATNMAYMLSAQLAAMVLNVEAGFVSGSALVYAPSCGNTGVGNNFISIADLMAAANVSLGANGVTVTPSSARTYQECLKNALDWANNNKNFVQPNPCPFSFYPVCTVDE